MEKKDSSAILPDGSGFHFWEKEPVYARELFVNAEDPAASGENDGSENAPFRTIGRAAAEGVTCDITGAPRTGETALPGPFPALPAEE